jgi:hypothetical protein
VQTWRAAALLGLRRALCRRRAPNRYALPLLFLHLLCEVEHTTNLSTTYLDSDLNQ